jgi:putative ABC transport system permease protein
MRFSHIIFSSLRFYWRSHVAVLLGVVLAVAVLTGALVVGDSVKHTLRATALQRLGGVHQALFQANRFFRAGLAESLQEETGTPFSTALSVRGMAMTAPGATREARSNQVQVLGVAENFWDFAHVAPSHPKEHEVILNTALAEALGVNAGDEIALRLVRPRLMPQDAPLASQEEDTLLRASLTVSAVVDASSFGRFDLSTNQRMPHNAYLNLSWLQARLGYEGRANMLLAGAGVDQAGLVAALGRVWRPEDVGLQFRKHPSGMVQLESDRIFLEEGVAETAMQLPHAAGTLTYLVNSIRHGEKSTPYSFAVAGGLGQALGDDEVLVNRWLADALDLQTGNDVQVNYAALLPSNAYENRDHTFRVAGILEMDTLTLERDLSPEFPGLSDVESCADWNVGMPMEDAALRDEANEAYWNDYGQTPKFFVSLNTGQALWANRFGALTTVRFKQGEASALTKSLQAALDPAQVGLVFTPVRRVALEAANPAMDFGGLFIGMSFVLITAALLLTALLFAFSAQQRSAEMGLLMALGYRTRQVRRLILGEAAFVALLGAVLGAPLGAVYSKVLLVGLERFWSGAVAHAAITFHLQASTLVIGGVAGFLTAWLAMTFMVRRQSRQNCVVLLQEDPTALSPTPRSGRVSLWIGFINLATALGATAFLFVSGADRLVLPFFGIGVLILSGGLCLFAHGLSRLGAETPPKAFSLFHLALQNLGRRRGRSITVAALLAMGCFMVFAVSAMQEDPGVQAELRSSGTGGFELIAESVAPLQGNPLANYPVPEVHALPLRYKEGDDAGCLNLNSAPNPPLIGVLPEEFAELGAFVKGDADSFWDALNLDLGPDEIPAFVGDADTAMWGLQATTDPEKGTRLPFKDEQGRPFTLRLVGRLPMRLSLFQGTLLISQKHFTDRFPSETGFRRFLIDTPSKEVESAQSWLHKHYETYGLQANTTTNKLKQFHAVEGAYLAMFLVLGGFGLLVGSLGMGVSMLRNLLERRRELALLQALGYARSVLFRLLLMEWCVLLLAGFGIGMASAFCAIFPSLLAADSSVSLPTQAALAGGLALLLCLTGLAVISMGMARVTCAALRNE